MKAGGGRDDRRRPRLLYGEKRYGETYTRAVRRERAVKVPQPKARPLPALPPPKEGDPRAIPPRRLASLPELARPSPFKTCQWLSGDGPFTDADKCGKGTVQGRSYCAGHCARAYQTQKTEQVA